jgi:heat shock protein HslJ
MRQKSALDGIRMQCVRRCLFRLFGRQLWLAVAWCTMAGAAAEEPRLEGTWQLRSVASSTVEPLAADELPSFTIKGVNVEGFDGCNHFFGPLDRPGAIGATRRACAAGAMLLPLDLNDLAAHLRSGRIEGDVLAVPARGPYPASTYARQAGSEGSVSRDVGSDDPGSSR